MFDNSFERSASYFTVLQISRKFSDTIRGSLDDLRAMRKKWDDWKFDSNKAGGAHPFRESRPILTSNWDTVVSYHNMLVEQLLSRIEKKTEEVKSLRDGV